MRAYCLSVHARYQCAHSGECCTAGWPIPIEDHLVPVLRRSGLLPSGRRGLRVLPSPVNGTRLGAGVSTTGACVFFDAPHGRLCAIHRAAGERALPASCRSFPRVALRDARGLFVTLSHYCPTAAGLLLEKGEIRIVDAPPSLSLDGELEGLDATAVLPPLLRDGMLADLEGYAAWEAASIAVLDDRCLTPRTALAIIREATVAAGRWRPGGASLARSVTDAFDDARGRRPERADGGPLDGPVKAFLAAHLFASWGAYERGGLAAVCDGLDTALALLGSPDDAPSFVAAVRSADLRLRHGVNPPVDRCGEPAATGAREG